MQIKVFKASSMKEAVTKMKAELGDDAVILHTKKYKEGGILGYGSKEMVEVTAAIEDEKPAVKTEPEKQQRPTIPVNPPSVLSQYKTNGTAEGLALAEKESRSSAEDESDKTADVQSSKTPTLMRPTLNPNVKNQASSLKEAMMPGAKSETTESKMPYEKKTTIPSEDDSKEKSTEENAAQLNDSVTQSSVTEQEKSDTPINLEKTTEEPKENIELNNKETKDLNNTDSTNATTEISNNEVAAQPQPMQPTQQAQQISTPPAPTQPQVVPVQEMQQVQQPDQNANLMPQPNADAQVMQQSQVAPLTNNQNIQMPLNAVADASQQVQPNQTMSAQNSIQNVQNSQPVQENAQQAMQGQQQNQTDSALNQQQVDMNQPLTPAQLAQAQAMMMAQFNQMQMAQAMQQAMVQAQAYQPQAVQAQQMQVQQVSETSESERKSQEKIQRLESEIAQMKALLAQVIGKDNNRSTLSLHEALKKQEVDENILNDMAAHAGAGETLSDSQSREAKSTLMKFLKENINFSEGIKLNRHGVRIAALLGTTGVGKTTTLAKIAAKFVLEQGITAALITADTYRISAVEQLRTYSDILGLPLEIVYSPIELSKAINKYRNRDLILIDTAGRSQHNDYQMKELQEFLRTNQRIEKHIVLSTTTKSSDANDILEKFSICEPDKIIFTKTDETASTGLILNLLYKQKLSLSYLTNGQSVPDDIIPANEEALADFLLRRNIGV